MSRKISFKRETKETNIEMEVTLDPEQSGQLKIDTSVAFLDHMLTAMAFHGGFNLEAKATGDIEVDYHHLVEDVGLVLGEILTRAYEQNGNVQRFAHSIIPMDEALSEVVIDICGRPTLVYKPQLPQLMVGTFDLTLMREFFMALANRAKISLHINLRYGENSHHMIEGAFKALGKAIGQAYSLKKSGPGISTKGTLA